MIDFLVSFVTWKLILAMVIAFGAGWVWYSDKVFGAKWKAEQEHRKEEDYSRMGEMLIASAISIILATSVIIIVVDNFGSHGFIAFLLTTLVGMYAGSVADGSTRTKWAIDGGYITLQYGIIMIGLSASAMA